MSKKIIGLSCGRKNGNCEILLKEAAMGAREIGVETEIIRSAELTVKPCTNCQACVLEFRTGKPPTCVIKDDLDWIVQKTVIDDCGLILSIPIFHTRCCGQFININDRMLPATMRHPETLKKTRVGGIITVGGAGSDWTNLGHLTANIFLQHTRKLVDQIQINDAPIPGVVLFDFHKKSRERARQLGRNVAEAMSKPVEDVNYMGESHALECPICHCNAIQVPQDFPEVVCPICWIHGMLEIQDSKMKVKWNEFDVQHPRFSEYAIKEHGAYIMSLAKKIKKSEADPAIAEMKKKYNAYGNIIKPPD
jgi:multimeric flavodoxin WrbA